MNEAAFLEFLATTRAVALQISAQSRSNRMHSFILPTWSSSRQELAQFSQAATQSASFWSKSFELFILKVL
jgi:hypothetical protein